MWEGVENRASSTAGSCTQDIHGPKSDAYPQTYPQAHVGVVILIDRGRGNGEVTAQRGILRTRSGEKAEAASVTQRDTPAPGHR